MEMNEQLKAKIKATLAFRAYKKSKKMIGKIKRKVNKFYTLRILYPSIYKEHAKKPVDEKKVVFIEVRHPELTNSLSFLYENLKENYTFDIHVHTLRTGFVSRREFRENCKSMIADIADAKYVFISDASNIVGCVPMRKETVYTQTWHGCGAFKKFGMSTAELIFGDSLKEMQKYPNHKNYTYVTVSSPEVMWAYEEAMNVKHEDNVVRATGISRTDVFFDQQFIENAKKKLAKVMPYSEGKKVILYAPTFRGRVAKAVTPDCLNIELFYQKLSTDYVLLFKHHPLVKRRPDIPEEYEKFAMDCTDNMTIEELICVSDICISDYSSMIFEYSIFERPMLFYAYDLDEYFDWRGFYYDYYELAPGPICTTSDEMVDYIEHIEERFDKNRVIEFKNKFMSSCDGHATDRIKDLVFGNELKKYHK
jgi:CDP-ribitol ribitolphosphotransferase